jgi:hypothetical protein
LLLCVGISVKFIAGKASALALCISYTIMLHSCCFHPEINTTVMGFYYGEKKPKASGWNSSWNLPCTKSMNCVSEITNYVRAMKQSAFCHVSFLSASAFYPFCPHLHFILFVRIRILSLLSASAFYPFCPHPHFILFVRPSACSSAWPSVRIRVLSQPKQWILSSHADSTAVHLW